MLFVSYAVLSWRDTFLIEHDPLAGWLSYGSDWCSKFELGQQVCILINAASPRVTQRRQALGQILGKYLGTLAAVVACLWLHLLGLSVPSNQLAVQSVLSKQGLVLHPWIRIPPAWGHRHLPLLMVPHQEVVVHWSLIILCVEYFLLVQMQNWLLVLLRAPLCRHGSGCWAARHQGGQLWGLPCTAVDVVLVNYAIGDGEVTTGGAQESGLALFIILAHLIHEGSVLALFCHFHMFFAHEFAFDHHALFYKDLGIVQLFVQITQGDWFLWANLRGCFIYPICLQVLALGGLFVIWYDADLRCCNADSSWVNIRRPGAMLFLCIL